MTTRREFFRTGMAGRASLLNVAGFLRPAAGSGRRLMATALIPVFPAGALPPAGMMRLESIARTVDGVDEATAGLSPATQEEFAELSDLQRFAPARMYVAGAWLPWPEASAEAVGRFLEISRISSLLLHGSGHAALHDPMLGAWRARPARGGMIATRSAQDAQPAGTASRPRCRPPRLPEGRARQFSGKWKCSPSPS